MSISKMFRFLDLPHEIRELVYKHLFQTSDSILLLQQHEEIEFSNERLGPPHRVVDDYPPQREDSRTEEWTLADGENELLIEEAVKSIRYRDPRAIWKLKPDQDEHQTRTQYIETLQQYIDKRISERQCGSSRYLLHAAVRPEISILLVNRQLYIESYPIFYRLSTFSLHGGLDGLLWLTVLPPKYRCCIRKIGIRTIAENDATASSAWGRQLPTVWHAAGMVLTSPYASVMSLFLPDLTEVLLEEPQNLNTASYGPIAVREISKLLRAGVIQSLKILFKSDHRSSSSGLSATTHAWATPGSLARYHALLKPDMVIIPIDTATLEFCSRNPGPELGALPCHCQKCAPEALVWLGKRHEVVKAWQAEFRDWLEDTSARKTVHWRWGHRNVSLDNRGDVQAVVEYTLRNPLLLA